MKLQPVYRLSGADAFFLALESRGVHASPHDRYCYYFLTLEGKPDVAALENQINDRMPIPFHQLHLKGKHNFFRPGWDLGQTSERVKIQILETKSCSSIEQAQAMMLDVAVHGNKLASFFLIRPVNASLSVLCFRWNHLLLDGQGASLLLQYLFDENQMDLQWYPDHEHTWFRLWPFYKIVRFISNTSHGPIFFPEKRFNLEKIPRFHLLTFNAEEQQKIDQHLSGIQAGPFRSLFYLAVTSQTMNSCAWWKDPSDFWVPIPINIRRPGSNGPVFSNRLSFYFFRIRRSSCKNLAECFQDLRQQMRFQASKNYPQIYLRLTNFMRFLPLGFFYIFVKGWKRKKHASFMFTMAQAHPKNFNRIQSLTIRQTLSLPPNTDPPGLTFAFLEENQRLQVMVQCREQMLRTDELTYLCEQLKINLQGN